MILIWSRRARAERLAIIRRLWQHNAHAALTLDQQFTQKTLMLPHHPFMGRPGCVPGTREFIIHPNYFLQYEVSATHVRILRVQHVARQFP